MVQKIFRIAGKCLLGIFLFYLFLCWIVIPAGLRFVAQREGSKILKRQVVLKGVSFHPFLWRLNLRGFEILDNNKTALVGFDRFSVDVSFTQLLKKIYRFESIKLSEPFVRTALLPGNKINLMDLVPPPNTPSSSPSEKNASQELPPVFVDKIIIEKAAVYFKDTTVTPQFNTSIHDVNVTISNVSTQVDDIAEVVLKAMIDQKGILDVLVKLKPLKDPLEMEASVEMNSYALTVLDPYVGKYTGRGLRDGKFDFKTTYLISDNKLLASHKILIQKFEFGDKVQSKDALHLPFGLAIALLEDPQGRINISLPAEGDLKDPKFKYTHLIWQVLKNFWVKLITKPFAILGSLVGSESGSDELGTVRFQPGKSVLLDEEKGKLASLIKGLNERPKLFLEINGSVDPNLDWKAIKTDVFNKDYETLREESKKMESWVYQQLYQRRFGIRDLWSLTKKYKQKDGTFLAEELNAEIKRQLIEDAPPDKLALDVLAQERAKVVYDAMVELGLDEKRLKLGVLKDVQGSFDKVPLEFTLTIFEQESGEKL